MILSWLCLTLLGWQPLDHRQVDQIKKRTVLLFQHSTYFDYIIFVLHKWAYPTYFFGRDFYVIMSERFSWIFFSSEFIISAPDEIVQYFLQEKGFTRFWAILYSFLPFVQKGKCKQGTNFIQKVKGKLETNQSFVLLISPTGSRDPGKWKSGYRAIAATLGCPFVVAGVDYMQKTLRVFEAQANTESEENLQARMNLIARKGQSTLTDAWDWPTLTSVVASAILVPKCFGISPLLGAASVIMSAVSFVYHYTSEQECRCLDTGLCFGLISTLLFITGIKGVFLDILNVILFCFGCFHLGRSWGLGNQRTEQYNVHHSYFHLFTSMALRRMLDSW